MSMESRHQSLRYFKSKIEDLCRICGKPRNQHEIQDGKFTFCVKNSTEEKVKVYKK